VIKKFSEEGPWIQKVPMDLPELLASLTSDELKAVAKKWAELKVLSLAFPIPKDKKFNKLILDYLKLLHKLSKKSVKLEQPMYLWTCL
jgi:hypothetical protein